MFSGACAAACTHRGGGQPQRYADTASPSTDEQLDTEDQALVRSTVRLTGELGFMPLFQ